MKARKKSTGVNDLEAVISGGTSGEAVSQSKKKGRPKSKVPKKQCPFYLPEDVVQAIDEHCRGNKSVFAEEIFREYFKRNKINI